MNPSFRRKIIYLVLIAALLYPLSQLSQPATSGSAGRPESPGGMLAQLRQENRLGQANLGKIDPTSATVKLVSLGMDGIAATVLWQKADKFKERKDWIGFKAVLDQIANLQPNFVAVWQFQAHNVGFNISAEWDDYRDRYYWVKQGIEFLQKGAEYNENEPRLLADIGYFATQKLGQSDERVQYRKLFAEDDDFHAKQHVHERDNWLFGTEYYREAQRVAENMGAKSLPMAPLMFYARSVLARTHYCDALEQDYAQALEAEAIESGRLRETPAERDARFARVDEDYRARIAAAWDTAGKMWTEQYGDREFVNELGGRFRLNDLEPLQKRLEERRAEFDKLTPGLDDKIRTERIAQLDREERAAFEMEPAARNETQERLAFQAEYKITPTHFDVAERVEGDDHDGALALANEVTELEARVIEIDGSRNQANFDYWVDRCAMEKSADAREARRMLHHAHTAFRIEADLVRAKQDFEQAFAHWRKVIDAHPRMLNDQTAYAILEAIELYEAVLAQLDEPFPDDFVLKDLLEVEVQGAPPRKSRTGGGSP